MIIENGYIKFKTKSGGIYNEETGSYETATEGWSDPIPCQWRALTSNLKGVSKGEAFEAAQYEVLIEYQEFSGERFTLFNLDESEVGEFSPTAINKYQLVNIIEILV